MSWRQNQQLIGSTYLEKEGIPCSKVNRVDEALESEQAKANDMVLEMDHPTSGNIRVPGIPYQFSKTPAGVQFPAAPTRGGYSGSFKTFTGKV